MTIFYDSGDHLALLTSTTGTVCRASLAPIVVVVAVYVILWTVDVYTRYDPPIMYQDNQEEIMSLLVAFLIVANNDIVAKRYDENRNLLMRFNFYARELAGIAWIHGNGIEGRDKLDHGNIIWRKKIKNMLVLFIKESMHTLQNPGKCLELTHKFPSMSEMQTRSSMMESSSKYGDGPRFETTHTENENSDVGSPYYSLRQLSAIVSEQNKLLTSPMVIQFEMLCYTNLNNMHTIIDDLFMSVTTPVPYPLTNIVKICLFVWACLVPFFIDQHFSFINIVVVFFLIYAVVGLDAVACEISDPFGDDCNDLEVEKIMYATLNHIEHLLGGGFNPFADFQVIDLETKTALIHDEVSDASIGARSLCDPQLRKHKELGWNDVKQSKYSSALDAFLNALALSKDDLEAASVNEIIGDIYVLKNMHDDAICHYQKSSWLIKKSTSSEKLVGNEFLLRVEKKEGDALFDTAQYRSALQCYTSLLNRHPKSDISHEMCDVCHRIGMLL